jgi:hypothetical protein
MSSEYAQVNGLASCFVHGAMAVCLTDSVDLIGGGWEKSDALLRRGAEWRRGVDRRWGEKWGWGRRREEREDDEFD